MVQKRDFDEQMSKLTDEELYNVLANENDYVPEAVESAKSELQSRNLSPERKAELKSITEERKKEEKVRSSYGQRIGNLVLDSIFLSVFVFVLKIIMQLSQTSPTPSSSTSD